MTEIERNTIRYVLAEATPKVGRFEAMILLAFVLDKPKEYLIAHDDETLDEFAIVKFDLFITMRLEGMPIPYLVGRQEFFGRYFKVNQSVLIPRPDTEVLIEQAQIVVTPNPRILDLGTGSGCIAITLAKECPNATVVATDRSAEALDVAKENAQLLGASIEFRQGSWWEPIGEEETFDLIVSNPPYIRPDDEHLLKLGTEPLDALTDHQDGLSAIAEIAHHAMQHLNVGGWLIVEHGYDQGEAVECLFRVSGLAGVRTVKDYGGNDRITMGRRAA